MENGNAPRLLKTGRTHSLVTRNLNATGERQVVNACSVSFCPLIPVDSTLPASTASGLSKNEGRLSTSVC